MFWHSILTTNCTRQNMHAIVLGRCTHSSFKVRDIIIRPYTWHTWLVGFSLQRCMYIRHIWPSTIFLSDRNSAQPCLQQTHSLAAVAISAESLLQASIKLHKNFLKNHDSLFLLSWRETVLFKTVLGVGLHQISVDFQNLLNPHSPSMGEA